MWQHTIMPVATATAWLHSRSLCLSCTDRVTAGCCCLRVVYRAVLCCNGTGGSKEFLVRASYCEIYNEEIRDLLSKNPQARLELKEHPERGVYVKDLMQFVVKSVAEINSVLQVNEGAVAWQHRLAACGGRDRLYVCVAGSSLRRRQ